MYVMYVACAVYVVQEGIPDMDAPNNRHVVPFFSPPRLRETAFCGSNEPCLFSAALYSAVEGLVRVPNVSNRRGCSAEELELQYYIYIPFARFFRFLVAIGPWEESHGLCLQRCSK